MLEASPYSRKADYGCRCVNYLGPNIEPGDPAALGEAGQLSLVAGQKDYDITFGTVKSGTYDADVSFSIPTGAVMQTFDWVTSNETNVGFRVSLSEEPVAPDVGDVMPIL